MGLHAGCYGQMACIYIAEPINIHEPRPLTYRVQGCRLDRGAQHDARVGVACGGVGRGGGVQRHLV